LTGGTNGSIAITLAGKTVTGATGLAQDPTTCLLWAILKVSGQSGRELVTLNPATGVATSVGNTGLGTIGGCAAITFATDGTLYGVTGTGAIPSETLFTLDKTNATPTLVVGLGNGDDGETIAFNPDDGLIYHASGFNSQVFETVNPNSFWP
jgi:hypothetical protein